MENRGRERGKEERKEEERRETIRVIMENRVLDKNSSTDNIENSLPITVKSGIKNLQKASATQRDKVI